MRFRKLLVIAATLALALTGAACGGDDSASSSTTSTSAGASTTAKSSTESTAKAASTSAAPTTTKASTTTAAPLSGGITVFAAASLTDAFNTMGKAFEAQHPGVTVTFNYAASSALVTQINEGAPVDVFASADEANMKKLTDAGGNGAEPVVFAHNELQIIVGAGNPKNIQSVKDLTAPDLLFVTAAPEVPIGTYAQQVLDKAGVSVTPVSLEANVKAVVTKVTSGEADAGIVYATDVTAAGASAEGVDIPADLNVLATYPIAVTKDAPNPTGAVAWIDFATGVEGQAILASFGFAPK